MGQQQTGNPARGHRLFVVSDSSDSMQTSCALAPVAQVAQLVPVGHVANEGACHVLQQGLQGHLGTVWGIDSKTLGKQQQNKRELMP